jgi:beta-glucosidase
MRHQSAFFILPFLLTLAVVAPSRAQAPLPDSLAIEQRVNDLLAKLTLEQKIDLIGGEDGMFIRSEPTVGLPKLKMTDGPLGAGTWGPSIAYASGIALAAAWDPELAKRVGSSIGLDARARGVHILLGPGVNIYRAPMNGRNFEYFGEDPFLAARTAVGYIDGVQSQGVMATVKHFAANNQEFDRHSVSSDVDERTLREIYLPAFEAAVREAHAGGVMNSYNLVNGIHATENAHLNLDILKKEWGFDGILMSDWDATYDGVAAAVNGLDLEMPEGKFMSRSNLLPAVQQGRVTQAVIDDKVRRILRTAIRFGFLDRTQQLTQIPAYRKEGRNVALDEARESIVLLKNENALLPLNSGKLRTIAVIGPDAWPAEPGGGGSSQVQPFAAVSLVEGLTNLTGAKVTYTRGLPTVSDFFDNSNFAPGGADAAQSSGNDHLPIKIESFNNPDFKGTPDSIEYADHLNSWKSEEWTTAATVRRGIRYSVSFLPEKSGHYLLLVAAGGADTYRLTIDGETVLEQTAREGQAPQWADLSLTAGKSIDLQLDYRLDASYPRVGLGLCAKDELISPETRKIAAEADAAVVSVGFDPTTESEGFDRTFALPWGQDLLIESVRKANAKTIVVLTSGGDVDTHGWLADVPALLDSWYPGQEGGTALAEVLLGVRSPEGKLPISFENSWNQNPVHDHYYAPTVAAGQTPHVKYAEGVFVGYRYYASANIKALFPFGFGLSYTKFSFSNLKLSASSVPAGGSLEVSFDVTNSGDRAGAEVAEVYVGDPSAHVQRPAKELKGFAKVRLGPGQHQHVSLVLDPRAFSYWSDDSHDWRIDPGRFVVYAGDSSEDTPLSADVNVGN